MKKYLVTGVSILGLAVAATALISAVYPARTQAHCQVPCGIYDDGARIARLREDATTIAKAIKNINELAGKHEAQALNQAVRWIDTKEVHASHIIQVVSEYFLTQKVKTVAPGADGYDGYLKKLADHHAVMVAAMKAKQSADPGTADKLQGAIDALAGHY